MVGQKRDILGNAGSFQICFVWSKIIFIAGYGDWQIEKESSSQCNVSNIYYLFCLWQARVSEGEEFYTDPNCVKTMDKGRHVEICRLESSWNRCNTQDQEYFFVQGHHELSGKSDENNPLKPNQSAPSIYIMIELCYFSLDQWEIRIHLLSGKCFNIPHDCDPHLDQTKFY